MCCLHIQHDLTSVKVAAEVFGTRKCVCYIGRLQGFWLIRVLKKEEGIGSAPVQWAQRFPGELEHPFQDPKLWKLQKLCTYVKLGSGDL